MAFPFARYEDFAGFVSCVHARAAAAARQDSGSIESGKFYPFLWEAFHELYGRTLDEPDFTTTLCSLLAAGYRAHSRFFPPGDGQREGRSVVLFTPPAALTSDRLLHAFRKYASGHEAF